MTLNRVNGVLYFVFFTMTPYTGTLILTYTHWIVKYLSLVRLIDFRVLFSDMDTVVVDTPNKDFKALVADTAWLRTRGLMLREPQSIALMWPKASKRSVHTFLCGSPLDVVWVSGDTVMRVSTVQHRAVSEPAIANTIIEAPAGNIEGIEPGDTVKVDN